LDENTQMGVFLNNMMRPRWFPWAIYRPVHNFLWGTRGLIFHNRFIVAHRWNKRKNKDKIIIYNFEYNGFCGRRTGGAASYTAQFIDWTNDAGIALMRCSDGRDRRVPAYAIEGPLPKTPNYNKLKKEGKFLWLGHASSSK